MSPVRKKAPAARPVAPKPARVPAKPAAVQNLGLEELKSLIALVAKESIHEFEFETGAVKFRIRKDSAAPAAAPAVPVGQLVVQQAPAPATTFVSPAAPASAPPPAATEDASLQYITSPIVGTFYRSPSPTAAAFVQPGDFVKPGQTLCIVEAMKLMNEIESDVAGEIVKVLVENGQPVEYGERIFAIRVN